MKTLQQHIGPIGPKRILALDGGGIRGALTLGYLQKIEDVLRKQHGDEPEFRLCDYFDLIGGTSTGSIIASCLAIGMKVEEITKMYMELGGKIFAKKYKWWNIFETGDFLKGNYDAAPLERELQNVFGQITLESDKIKTGLCIVAKRADTNSVWPLINHPKGKYYNSVDGKNKDILLWKAVRASAAAPTYFIPQLIEVGGGLSTAAFVDGGVSMANNPSLQLLMVATLKGFPFHWKMGADNILLVSVGTGMSKWEKIPKNVSKQHLLNWAQQIPDMLMQDASWHNQAILQWLSNCDTRWSIDGEIGDLTDDLITNDPDKKGLLTYLRYNLWLDVATLKQLMNNDYTGKQVDDLVEMCNADSRQELYKIGDAGAKNGALVNGIVAATEVKEKHFPDNFKI
ncbi:MAG TPA: patatin-like phospholipase family protein [Chitinophagaceae bacterium]|nr:patatin-like phospholipase family protein [Chitinophagaceae bacterium]